MSKNDQDPSILSEANMSNLLLLPKSQQEVKKPTSCMGRVCQRIASYKRKHLTTDVTVGLTMAAIVIPQSMAYALLAGLPPVYGLYSSILPPLIYCICGGSSHLSFGTFALVSLLLSSGLEQAGFLCNGRQQGPCPLELANLHSTILPSNSPIQYINAAMVVSVLVGGIQIMLAICRLGSMMNLLSDPVMSGFTTGASFLIAASQFKSISGIQVPRGKTFFYDIWFLLRHYHQAKAYDLVIGFGGVVVLFCIKFVNKKYKFKVPIPAHLLVIIGSTIIVWTIGLQNRPYNVEIVGNIRGNSTLPFIPHFTNEWKPYKNGSSLPLIFILGRLSCVIAIISFIISTSIAKAFSVKYNSKPLNFNYELASIGFGNILGSSFGCYPSSGSLSRSSLVGVIGGSFVTKLHNLFTSSFVLISFLFLTRYFFYIPKSILAAIILSAVPNLCHFSEAVLFYRIHKLDFMVWSFTFGATVLTNVTDGVVLGVIFSFLALLGSSCSKVRLCELVYSEDKYSFIENQVPRTSKRPEVLIAGILTDQLHFFNVSSLEVQLETLQKTSAACSYGHILRTIVIDMESVRSIDSTALNKISRILTNFSDKGIEVAFSKLRKDIKHLLEKSTGKEIYNVDSIDDALARQRSRDRDNIITKEIP